MRNIISEKEQLISMLIVLVMTAVLAAGCFSYGSSPKASASYEELIFDTSRVHTIEVTMSEEDRADQLKNPTEKTKYKVDVVIDGEKFKDVAFHTKGNSSLFFPVKAGMDKYSYGLNFKKFKKGGTYHGLNKLNLQNNFNDASSIKAYMAFHLFRRMDVDAPLASYVWLTVNGEDQGLYTALEDISAGFLERTAGGKGTIYEPQEEEIGLNDEEMDKILGGASVAHDTGGGADLVYRDDRKESYPDIFENASTSEEKGTQERVIRALKALSEKKDLEKYLDTEKIIKYFAVHDYLVSYDSYTGAMLHNYYLYEKDGRLAMLPWDYDSCFGTFPKDAKVGGPIDIKEVINTGVDSPLGNVPEEDRPMWSWILSDETYLKKYHDLLSDVADVIDAGEYEEEANRIADLIRPYIEKEPKAYFTPDRFEKAHATLLRISELRAESVRRQVTGRLATRSEDQAEEDQVDTSGIDIQVLGSAVDLQPAD